MLLGFLAKKAITYSFRHYPVCTDCNPGVNNQFQNGCIAAYALEAAGAVGGAEKYFAMKRLMSSK